ncbi:MAG: phosphosulfolactate synthase [Limnochordaceae bacterium]|nr:phosphosulfolactate synthase [Limnochordaceae bacterium]
MTMVIDKGVPPAYFLDLLEMAAPHVQLWKLAFASALLYRPDAVLAKVEAGRAMGVEVYAGGTLLELSRVLGDPEEVLVHLKRLGFAWVEVSNGTFDLGADERLALIASAREQGFRVLTEVGSKDPGRPFRPEDAAEQVELDLDAGAEWVIIEARDSGRGVGIFDEEGRLRVAEWQRLAQLLSRPSRVIWEAPRVEQQRELLLRLGPDAGLGNVQVGDVLTLAAMRWGLRADTLRPWAAALTPGCTADNM